MDFLWMVYATGGKDPILGMLFFCVVQASSYYNASIAIAVIARLQWLDISILALGLQPKALLGIFLTIKIKTYKENFLNAYSMVLIQWNLP